MKILIDLLVDFFYNKGSQTYDESCMIFLNLKFKKKNFDEFLPQNNIQIFVIFTYFPKSKLKIKKL